jgi:hypothetical protein
VSVTFRPEPEPRDRAIGYQLECVVEARRDRRSFPTYEAAVAGLADHHRYCGDALCFPGIRYIVSRRPGDGEPSLNVGKRQRGAAAAGSRGAPRTRRRLRVSPA